MQISRIITLKLKSVFSLVDPRRSRQQAELLWKVALVVATADSRKGRAPFLESVVCFSDTVECNDYLIKKQDGYLF